MDDILTAPVNGSGCNEKYGLLGSNKSTEDTIKLFPRECSDLVYEIQKQILDRTGKHVEVMVYLSLIHILSDRHRRRILHGYGQGPWNHHCKS